MNPLLLNWLILGATGLYGIVGTVIRKKTGAYTKPFTLVVAVIVFVIALVSIIIGVPFFELKLYIERMLTKR